MASLKKEVMSLISRFDAAQEAFAANSAELKTLRKQHKKALKAAKAEAKKYRVEVEALKAELAILKMEKAAPKAPAKKPVAKATAKKAAPKKVTKPVAKKATAAAKPTGEKRGPGRPRTKPAVPLSPLQVIPGFGPSLAKNFEAAGVKSPAGVAKLSDKRMKAILEKCGPRYRNADEAKMKAMREAAASVK